MRRFWLLIFPVLAYFVGCGSQCDGVEVNGRCETQCDEAKCQTGFKCFQNACSKPCDEDGDCSQGRTCERTVSDKGESGRLCVYANGAPPNPPGQNTDGPCESSDDCASNFGFRCIESKCTLTCEVHSHCGAQGSCTGTAQDAEKHTVRTCEADEALRGPKQFGTRCPNGNGECDADANFTCVSAGPGDIDAYCTLQFCEDDSACPSGFFCSNSRSAAPPCADSCGLKGQDVEGCIPASDIGAGKHYECGPVSLTTHLCLAREFCNECKTNADCLGKPNQVCAKDESGQKICTVLCDGAVNSCPWGTAAVCGLWDDELGKETCTHRFGSCTGTGKSCEPCLQQADCPDGYCAQTQFTGERYCVDLGVSCSCPEGTTGTCNGGGCPKTPAGKPMTCLGGSAYKDSPLVGKCVGASSDALSEGSRQGCWPSL